MIVNIKLFVIFFNFLVAYLNWKVYTKTNDNRDFWASIAWVFAGLAWCAGLIGG